MTKFASNLLLALGIGLFTAPNIQADHNNSENKKNAIASEEEISSKSRRLISKFVPASIFEEMKKGKELSGDVKKEAFIKDCKEMAIENKSIPQRNLDDKKLRIATYNVHLWKEPYFTFDENISPKLSLVCQEQNIDRSQTKITPVLDVIDNLQADILCLQEVRFRSKQEWEDYKKILRTMGYKYGLDAFADMRHHVQNDKSFFGNWIISKYPLTKNPHVQHFNNQYDATKLKNAARDHAYRCFEQTTTSTPSGETYSIYTLHLDVFDESEQIRLKQIQELVDATEQDQSDHVILTGDFNSVRPQDYRDGQWELIQKDNASRTSFWADSTLGSATTPTMVLDYLQEHGFVDCFTKNNMEGPQFTTWAGTTIDFIMIKDKKEENPLPIDDCNVYYNADSDHIPVIMDIKLK